MRRYKFYAGLVQVAGVNQRDKQGSTCLLYAAYWGHMKVINALCANGANPNQCNNSGPCFMQ